MPPPSSLWPRFKALESRLKEREQSKGARFHVAIEGYSPHERPVYAVTLTDPATPPADKQHVVLSAVHAGVERSATATLLRVMDWLVSDDPAAREVLRRQVIVCLPLLNPDEYVHGCRTPEQKKRHNLLYTCWDETGVTEANRAPEAVALQNVIDRLKPDLYADVHGISLDFENQLMVESSASSPTRVTSRPYHQRIARLMDEAALEEGFPSDFQEDDRELQYWGPSLEQLRDKLWTGRDIWAPGLYAYARYHALHVVMEITWPQSGLARFKRLFSMGGDRWEGEPDTGYPNRIVGPSGMYQEIAAYGTTAEEKRQSRVDLWQKRPHLASAGIDPQQVGKTAAVFTLSDAAFGRHLKTPESTAALLATLEGHPAMNTDYLAYFFKGWPVGQNRPEPFFGLKSGNTDTEPVEDAKPIRHGASFRLRIPFRKAALRELRLNGHPLAESCADGYQTWTARGFTFVQVNIPPGRTQIETVFIVTCAYDPGETRTYWDS